MHNTIHFIFWIVIGILTLAGIVTWFLYGHYRNQNRYQNLAWKKDFKYLYKLFFGIACFALFVFWLVVLGNH